MINHLVNNFFKEELLPVSHGPGFALFINYIFKQSYKGFQPKKIIAHRRLSVFVWIERETVTGWKFFVGMNGITEQYFFKSVFPAYIPRIVLNPVFTSESDIGHSYNRPYIIAIVYHEALPYPFLLKQANNFFGGQVIFSKPHYLLNCRYHRVLTVISRT